MTEVHQQLQESVHHLESIRQSIKYAEELTLRLEEEKLALEPLEKQVTKDQLDILKLEKEGVTSFLREFIGDREEKLEKEQAEYDQTSEHFVELHKSIELMEFELGILKQKHSLLEGAEKKVTNLYNEREKELLSSDKKTADVLKNLDVDRTQHDVYIKKIEKLIVTCNSALIMVSSIENHLDEAREHWLSHKAGAVPSAYDCLDNARRPVQKTNQLLSRFKKELFAVFPEIQFEEKIELEKF